MQIINKVQKTHFFAPAAQILQKSNLKIVFYQLLNLKSNFESKIEKIANLTDSIVGLKSEDFGLLNLNPLNWPPDILIFII